jgi:hypothetical protein
MRVLGIDPDTTTPAFAVAERIDGEVTITRVDVQEIGRGGTGMEQCAHYAKKFWVPQSLRDINAVVMEGQKIYPTSGKYARRGARKTRVNPNSILSVAFTAGVTLGALLTHLDEVDFCPRTVLVPEPEEWTRGQPKLPRHVGLCKRLGWDYEEKAGYTVPLGTGLSLRISSHWKHAMDAVGLATWGLTKLEKR